MGRVLLPEQLLRAVLSRDQEAAVPGAMQLGEALLYLAFHHMTPNLSAQAVSARAMAALHEMPFTTQPFTTHPDEGCAAWKAGHLIHDLHRKSSVFRSLKSDYHEQQVLQMYMMPACAISSSGDEGPPKVRKSTGAANIQCTIPQPSSLHAGRRGLCRNGA